MMISRPRRITFCVTAAVAVMLMTTIAIKMPRWLIWNVSASVAEGLYLSRPASALRAGQLVVVMPPPALASFMVGRRYLGAGVPMLKHVAAVGGQTVCRSKRRVRIDGKLVVFARRVDRRSRPLPVWQGCRHVGRDEVFLLNANIADSFDGRYFGVLQRSSVIGRAVPLWTWKPKA